MVAAEGLRDQPQYYVRIAEEAFYLERRSLNTPLTCTLNLLYTHTGSDTFVGSCASTATFSQRRQDGTARTSQHPRGPVRGERVHVQELCGSMY